MAKIIQFDPNQANTKGLINATERFRSVFEKARKDQLEPLTQLDFRKNPELDNLTEEEALNVIETIKKLAAVFFEITHRKEAICIDNQLVVNLNQENKVT